MKVAVIGGGPGGLMAAEILSRNGVSVTIYDHKPSFGRKFLMAGRGGLNITHDEPFEKFISHYDEAAEFLRPALEAFTPDDLRNWCKNLGEETFTGTSGKVFPKSFKATPLLRAWLERLQNSGVEFKTKHKWLGWDNAGKLLFSNEDEDENKIAVNTDAVILALGGASWPHLGSDANWIEILKDEGIAVAEFKPANCGFITNWSNTFVDKFKGQPVKSIALSFKGKKVLGEIMITEQGIEGSAIYALSRYIRNQIEISGNAEIFIDLRPNTPIEKLSNKLSKDRKSLSFSNFLRKSVQLSPIEISLIREAYKDISKLSAIELAKAIKAVPINFSSTTSIEKAISSAGGIKLSEINADFSLKKKPKVYAVGEMLDWESPTGGYLLQATFSTAAFAANCLLSNDRIPAYAENASINK